MKYYLTIILTWLITLTQANGQGNHDSYSILTVNEMSLSGDNVKSHYFISPYSNSNSIAQFDHLYFDETIDYSFQKKCQNGDTLKFWDMALVWGFSAIDDFKKLETIVLDNKKLVKTLSTDKAKFNIFITSISGRFCQCYTKSDYGKISKMYLPINNFSLIKTENQDIQTKDFDLMWTKYQTRMSN